FEVRPHLAVEVLLLGMAVYASIPSAAQSAPGADAANALEQIAAEILEAQTQGGPYAKELIEPLRDLSFAYQEKGERALELAALEQARQVVRANYGLSSLEQAPLMRQQIRAEESRGNFAVAWELEQALLTLAHKHPDDVRAAPIYHEIGDKRMGLMRSYLAGERPPQLTLGCFYHSSQQQQPGSYDSNCASGGRGAAILHMTLDAQRNYSNAIAVLRRQQEHSGAELYELEDKVLRNSYLLRDYPTGRRSLVRLIYDDAANDEPTLSRIERLVQLADWDLLYDQRPLAFDLYERTHAYLTHGGVARASIDELFAPATPILLPTFQPNLLAPERAEGATGYVEVVFDVSRYGRTSRIRVLDSNASNAVQNRLTRWIVANRFRPRVADGEVVDTSRIVARAYVQE
ncbi:MAG TPA: hypothetical protein VNP02_06340, partial [Gammaproteobacteria bacterium]|nr:hypothetical protein [Gammaproteobacteria bacterium]